MGSCQWAWEKLAGTISSHALEFGWATLPLVNSHEKRCLGPFGVMVQSLVGHYFSIAKKHKKSNLASFGVMDHNLFWQNSSLPMANERSRSWSFGVMDQCLVWQHSPLLISMSNVGSNHSESWSRVLLGKTSLLIMGVRKVNPDNLDHDQRLVGEHSTLAKAMSNVVWNHLESWVPLGNTLSLLMGMTKVVWSYLASWITVWFGNSPPLQMGMRNVIWEHLESFNRVWFGNTPPC